MRDSPEHLEGGSLVAALGAFPLPIELDRVRIFGRTRNSAESLRFSFMFRNVPFECVTERRSGVPYLILAGDLGGLSSTTEDAHRRQSVQTIVTAATRRSGMHWALTPQQQIQVRGALTLDRPLTGLALVAGAVTLLLRAKPYLDLLLDTLSHPKG